MLGQGNSGYAMLSQVRSR